MGFLLTPYFRLWMDFYLSFTSNLMTHLPCWQLSEKDRVSKT